MFRYLGVDGTTWRVAASLRIFGGQITELRGTTKTYPTDGTLGDTAHSNRVSDHNPDDDDVVRALDFHEVVAGQVDAVAEELRASRDPRLKYFIHGGRIFKSYVDSAGRPAWQWQTYTGPNDHGTHGHLSVVADSRAEQTHPWQIGATPMADHPPRNHTEFINAHKITDKPSWIEVWDTYYPTYTSVKDSWAWPAQRLDIAYFHEKAVLPLVGRIKELEADVGGLLSVNANQTAQIASLASRIAVLEARPSGGSALPKGTKISVSNELTVL